MFVREGILHGLGRVLLSLKLIDRSRRYKMRFCVRVATRFFAIEK